MQFLSKYKHTEVLITNSTYLKKNPTPFFFFPLNFLDFSTIKSSLVVEILPLSALLSENEHKIIREHLLGEGDTSL